MRAIPVRGPLSGGVGSSVVSKGIGYFCATLRGLSGGSILVDLLLFAVLR